MYLYLNNFKMFFSFHWIAAPALPFTWEEKEISRQLNRLKLVLRLPKQLQGLVTIVNAITYTEWREMVAKRQRECVRFFNEFSAVSGA